MHIQVSIDGGVTWIEAPDGVRVSIPDLDVPGEDEPGQLDFNFTAEGVITDIWVSRQEHLEHNMATSAQEYGDLMSNLIGEDE